MAEFVLLCQKITLGSVGGWDFNGDSFDHCDSCLLDSLHFSGVVRHEPQTADTEIAEHFETKFVISVICFKTQMLVRLNRVHSLVLLKLVGAEFVDQADAAAFLQLINQNSASLFSDGTLGKLELIAAIAPAGVENISCQTLRM